MVAKWGLLGPEFLPNGRRTRTLGLGASVRLFNDLAVPGLGGVWYCKQLLLATIGVAVAEDARNQGAKVQNIEVANAIEALACRLAFGNNGWGRDARLRGRTKLRDKDDFSFLRLRQRNFYVTQPMRMATVQALPALGFVESDSTRFNAFSCSDAGRIFIEEVTKKYRPYNRTVVDHLTKWVQGESDKLKDSRPLREVLSPLELFPKDAISLLRERFIQGGNESQEDKERRGNALAWVDALRIKPERLTWEVRPPKISKEHWHDLQAGALFFETRTAAIAVLDVVEAHIENQCAGRSMSLNAEVPSALIPAIENLKSAAKKYLAFKHADKEASTFCGECTKDDTSEILRSVVKRDGLVLRLIRDEIKPGPAFRGSVTQSNADDEDQITPQAGSIPLPEGISYRVRNLYLLNLDMHDELDGWLNREAGGDEA